MKVLRLPLLACSLIAGALAAGVLPAAAHHSYSMFDMDRKVVMDATVARFKWQNPHAFIDADVTVRGRTERWAIEMTSPNNLVQSGWKRTSLKPGDRVKIHVHPLRNGSRGGAYAGIVLANGSTLGDVD